MLIAIFLLTSCSTGDKRIETVQQSSSNTTSSKEQVISESKNQSSTLIDENYGLIITPQIQISDKETVAKVVSIIRKAKSINPKSNPFDCTPYVVEFATKDGIVEQYEFNSCAIKKLEKGSVVAWYECDDASFEFIKGLCK